MSYPYEFIYRENELVSLKVCVRGQDNNQEIAISNHIKSFDDAEHPGRANVRATIEDFTIQTSHGVHQCLVFTPLGMTLTNLRDLFKGRALETGLLQWCLSCVVLGLDFLHQTGIVHTGMHTKSKFLKQSKS